MFGRKYLFPGLVSLGVAVALVVTFRIGYSRGSEAVRTEVGVIFQESFATDNAVALDRGVRVLAVAARHPDAFTKDELAYWRRWVEGWRFAVEKEAIPYWRKHGSEERATYWANVVQRANELESKFGRLPATQ
jgi:hypothetical protein